MKNPLILAIDTSCDETAAAVTHGTKILSNVIDSQINIHAQYGGVVPHLAKRAHEAKIEFVVREAIKRSTTQAVDAIAVTVGPGLAPALEVGINYAKKLASDWKKPLIAINHLEGHLLSSLAQPNSPTGSVLVGFPAIALLVSGGHTELVLVKKIGDYKIIGQTLDDAAGEALDKLAKMLHLGYPGGPIIEELARSTALRVDANPIKLPVPMQHSKDLNFSFSGLKTAAMYIIQKNKITKDFIQNMAASFQKTITISLCTKLKNAIKQYQPKVILLGGGVISNLYLRRQIRLAVKPLPVLIPYSKKLFTDNAAMIGIAAYHHYLNQDFVANFDQLDRQPNLNF
jgi:N6-L-threonylcarbamoyladenine synthase